MRPPSVVPSHRPLAVLIFLAGWCVSLLASANDTIDVYGGEFEVLGVRISKSSIVRVANINGSRVTMSERPIYLPAGTPIVLTNGFQRGRNQRQWALSITEDGLLVYVRTDGTHYINPDNLEKTQNIEFAISQNDIVVPTELYGNILITPSEIFTFSWKSGENIEIVIDEDKMRSAYTEDDHVSVSAADFRILSRDYIEDHNNFTNFFQDYDVVSELLSVLNSFTDLRITDDERENIQQFLERKYIREKDCQEMIQINLGVDAEIAAELRNRFLPVEGGLGLTGEFKQTITFPIGLAFDVERFRRYHRDDGGYDVYEILTEQIREECRDLVYTQRVFASGPSGLTGRDQYSFRATARAFRHSTWLTILLLSERISDDFGLSHPDRRTSKWCGDTINCEIWPLSWRCQRSKLY